MPVDPTTGEELPYPGQPGYEEAKKKNPEAYAAEEGGDAGEGQSVMDVANRLDELAGAEAGEGFRPRPLRPTLRTTWHRRAWCRPGPLHV